jgi:hypothetical protein
MFGLTTIAASDTEQPTSSSRFSDRFAAISKTVDGKEREGSPSQVTHTVTASDHLSFGHRF